MYGRVAFACPISGDKIETAASCWQNKAKYTEGANQLMTTLETQSVVTDLQVGEEQNLATAFAVRKTYYEQLGYEVVVEESV